MSAAEGARLERRPRQRRAGPRAGGCVRLRRDPARVGDTRAGNDAISGAVVIGPRRARYGRRNDRTKNAAIWLRSTGESGQYWPFPHPEVMRSRANCSIQPAAQ